MQQIIGIVKHDQMTCLADGLQTLVTRDSKLRTLENLSSQTIAQISISLNNIKAS